MRVLGLWTGALALTCATLAAAQPSAVRVQGQLREPGVANPQFDSPRVDIYVLTDKLSLPEDDKIVDEGQGELGDNYSYTLRFPADNVRNNYVMVVASANGYFPMTPDNKVGPRIKRVNDVGQVVDMSVDLKRRSVLAELYRSEANSILRAPAPSPQVFERASQAAENAVEIDPRLDNYLLAIKVTRQALSESTTYPGLLASRTDIESLGGFSGLPLAERWRVMSELLDSLMLSPTLELPVTRTENVGDLAVRLGQDMVAQINFDDPVQTALPVTRIFHTLSVLHTERGDCQSLIDNNATALSHADALQSNWSSQRSLYLSWADCLTQMSGGAGTTGRSDEAYITQTSANGFLKSQWARFAGAAKRVEERLAFATSGPDQRLKDLISTATQISTR